MASIPSLLALLKDNYPHLLFVSGDDFHFEPSLNTIYIVETHPDVEALLLHEVAHSVLEHHEYQRDVQLLSMETDAWDEARRLALHYGVTIDTDTQEDHLESYREWLHARSRCPRCEATGIQSSSKQYHCLSCMADWTVNEARTCQLRRFQQKTPH